MKRIKQKKYKRRLIGGSCVTCGKLKVLCICRTKSKPMKDEYPEEKGIIKEILSELPEERQSTIKDKFEEAIRTVIQGHALSFEAAAKKCNTLHQQAMKEEREKHKQVYKWLLECKDFPLGQNDRKGLSLWRMKLHRKLANIGIIINDL